MKEVVSDLKIFAQKGCKIASAKKMFSTVFFHLLTPIKHLYAQLLEVQCPKFLNIQNPWGKVMEIGGLREIEIERERERERVSS